MRPKRSFVAVEKTCLFNVYHTVFKHPRKPETRSKVHQLSLWHLSAGGYLLGGVIYLGMLQKQYTHEVVNRYEVIVLYQIPLFSEVWYTHSLIVVIFWESPMNKLS